MKEYVVKIGLYKCVLQKTAYDFTELTESWLFVWRLYLVGPLAWRRLACVNSFWDGFHHTNILQLTLFHRLFLAVR